MSIFIKGMEMPKDDKQITIKNYWINKEAITSAYDSVTNEFIGVVVEVPESHGRLIDADECAVYREHYETYNDYSTAFNMIDIFTPSV